MGVTYSSSQTCSDSLSIPSSYYSNGFTYYSSSTGHFEFEVEYNAAYCSVPFSSGTSLNIDNTFAAQLVASDGTVYSCFGDDGFAEFSQDYITGMHTQIFECDNIPISSLTSGSYTFDILTQDVSGDAYPDVDSGSFTITITQPSIAARHAQQERQSKAKRMVAEGQKVVSLPSGEFCDAGTVACPVPGRRNNGWECIDVMTNLDSCGACPGAPGWVDCASLPGVSGVSCVKGQCVVTSCDSGYLASANLTSCEAL